MKTKFYVAIEQAIEKVVFKEAEELSRDGLIYDELVRRMAEAAEKIFDVSMEAQKYAREND